MPQVPFQPVPQVGPSYQPTPRWEAQVSPDTFGANIGAAVRQLGSTADQVGNEIFARGMAMQDLYNHSEAQDADAQYMQKAGELHANYSSLAGKAAVDAYPKYIQDLQSARSQIRDGMSNGMAQKLFDASSLSTMGRTIFNGAGHAATENKRFAIGASTARVDAISDQTLATPADDGQFAANLGRVETEVRAQGQLQGLAPEAVDEAVAQKRSDLWGQRIKGLVRTVPLTAGKLLEDGIKSGDIRGEDIAKLTNLVQSAQNTAGARYISNQVATGAGNRWGQGPVDIKQAAEAIGQFESGGNYGTVGVDTAHGRALGKYQVMTENLPEFLAKAGLPSMTSQEFLANHAAQDQVFSAVFGGYMKQTGNFNDAASMWFSGKPQAEAGQRKDALGTSVPAYISATNAILARNAPLEAKVAMGQQIAAEHMPENPNLPDVVKDRIIADHGKDLAIQRDQRFSDEQAIGSALLGGKDGKLPTTVDELRGNPDAAAAWDRLSQSNPLAMQRFMKILASNAKGDTAWSEDKLRQYQQFKGMAQSDPADFIDTDVIGTNLPISARKELVNLQQSLKGKAEGDPRITRAMQILAPDLQAAGITKSADKDSYYQFVGALSDQLQDFATENKKPPKLEDVKQIGARLMQAHTTKGWLFDSQTPTFQVPVPSDEADKIKADPAWTKLGITPTDAQVQRIYTRKIYQDFYGGAPKSAKAPEVAVSQ